MKLKLKEILIGILFVVILTICMFAYKKYVGATELGHADTIVIKSNDVKVPKTLMLEIQKKLEKLEDDHKSKRIEFLESEIKVYDKRINEYQDILKQK